MQKAHSCTLQDTLRNNLKWERRHCELPKCLLPRLPCASCFQHCMGHSHSRPAITPPAWHQMDSPFLPQRQLPHPWRKADTLCHPPSSSWDPNTGTHHCHTACPAQMHKPPADPSRDKAPPEEKISLLTTQLLCVHIAARKTVLLDSEAGLGETVVVSGVLKSCQEPPLNLLLLQCILKAVFLIKSHTSSEGRCEEASLLLRSFSCDTSPPPVLSVPHMPLEQLL